MQALSTCMTEHKKTWRLDDSKRHFWWLEIIYGIIVLHSKILIRSFVVHNKLIAILQARTPARATAGAPWSARAVMGPVVTCRRASSVGAWAAAGRASPLSTPTSPPPYASSIGPRGKLLIHKWSMELGG